MHTITANELKRKGVSGLSSNESVIITVHGHGKFILMPITCYDKMHEKELDLALLEAKKDIKSGDYKTQTAAEHIQDIERELQNSDHKDV